MFYVLTTDSRGTGDTGTTSMMGKEKDIDDEVDEEETTMGSGGKDSSVH